MNAELGEGFRQLRPVDVIQPGDEYQAWSDASGWHWQPTQLDGLYVEAGIYRRKIETNNQTEQQ